MSSNKGMSSNSSSSRQSTAVTLYTVSKMHISRYTVVVSHTYSIYVYIIIIITILQWRGAR